MVRSLLILVTVAHGIMAQTAFDRELLGRVRQHVEADIAGLPNYTCQETMDRSIHDPLGKIEFRERLRLEVLFTTAGELFAWPGSAEFSTVPLDSWIGAGAISSGNFGAELHNLFLASAATLKYAGLEVRDQPLYRFDFRAPFLASRHILMAHGRTTATAYSGSFWVNQSLDIIRLDTRSEGIPPDLDCRDARESVRYGRVRLDVGDRLVPTAAELILVQRDGRESHNSIAFSSCHRYAAQASLSFSIATAAAVPAPPHPDRQLPAGVDLVLRLEQPISTDESAAGDQIVARLDKAVRSGNVLLPKGSRVIGRIGRLEQHFSSPASYRIGLQFFAAESPRGQVAINARLTGPLGTPDRVVVDDPSGREGIERGVEGLDIEDDGTTTGVGVFRVHGKQLYVRRGFRTLWKTQ